MFVSRLKALSRVVTTVIELYGSVESVAAGNGDYAGVRPARAISLVEEIAACPSRRTLDRAHPS